MSLNSAAQLGQYTLQPSTAREKCHSNLPDNNHHTTRQQSDLHGSVTTVGLIAKDSGLKPFEERSVVLA